MTQNLLASIVLALAVLAWGWILANKQITTINTPAVNGTLSTTAEGRVSVSPDMISLALSVYSRAQTSKEAYDSVNTWVAALKKILKESGVADVDVQTTGIYLNPEYNYVDGTQKPNGFSATHSLSVKIRKLSDANTLLDKVTEIVNVQIQSVTYDLDKKDPIYTEARKLAIEKARAKADEMAKVSWVKIKKVQSLSEGSQNSNYPLPYQNAKVMSEWVADSTTSLSPWQLEYTVNVSATYELE